MLNHIKVKNLRLEKNYTQFYMAQKLNKSVKWYRQLEKGISNPSFQEAEIIANELDVPIESLRKDLGNNIFHNCNNPTVNSSGTVNTISNSNEVIELLLKVIDSLRATISTLKG